MEDTCGKVQVKGSSGLRGMSLKDIEDLIKNNIKNDDTLASDFKRIKPKKGESKRLLYCGFMKDKLPNLWSQYNKGKEPVVTPSKVPRTEAEEIYNTLENLGFTVNVNANTNEKEINYSGGDEAEEEPRVVIPTMRNRTKVKDPLAGKIAPALQAKVNAKLRQMKRTNIPIPSFGTLRDKALFVLALNPKEFKKTQATLPTSKRVTRITFPIKNNRRPTKPEKIQPPKKEFSREQVRTANKFANNVVNTIRGLNENNIRSVLKNRYPNTNVSALLKNIMNLGKNAEYGNLRELIRTKELSRMVPEGSPPRAGAGPSFSTLPAGVSLENRAVEIRKKKVSNQTPRERQILRIVNKMRSARRSTVGPSVRMSTKAAGAITNSNNNSPKNLAPLPKLLQKANNNNNSDSEIEEKNVVRKLLLKQSQKVRIIGPQTLIEGKNVNKMTTEELMDAAKMLANKVMPGKKVDFKANNKNRLLRVVKAAAKKYISMK